jgi:hypothetical protein
LADAAAKALAEASPKISGGLKAAAPKAPTAPFVAVVDAEQVRAAVTVALDAAMGSLVDEIAQRVLQALDTAKSAAPAAPVPAPSATPATPTPAASTATTTPVAAPSAPAPAATAPVEPVRRVNPLRGRPGSILRLDLRDSEPPSSDS